MIVVVGIGAGGWDEIPVRHQQLIREAATLLGGKRHLDVVPDLPGQRREPWPSPLRDGLPALLESLPADAPVVALASGDPLVSGIGTTLISLLGRENVRIEPAVSSVSLARARMGWPAESCAVVSVVGRDVSLVGRELAPGRRILALSSDGSTPASIANLLVTAGLGGSVMTVLGELGAETESSRTGTASTWAGESPRLNIVAIECVGAPLFGWAAGLPDDAFENDGQLTKRDLRASALARLAPTPGEHLWDVGAGAGSVGIEWMRAHPSCTTTAIEGNSERAARIARNAARLGVPSLTVVEGRAPDALRDLPAPDAIFIGGGATRPGVLDACLAALRPGGRLVVHGVTLETEQLLAGLYEDRGGELTRIAVETTAPIGSFTGWAPARTVTQWAYTANRS
ncbi:precorrin-6y C5,15-methyltransferase (decarboxylating) subunit CbiE [Nocardioides sp. NPDC057767]|uniref:precorrin-6y C5,15-methyltransferase (decarboxylating) subunit CbiE n=1 Tax=unclassified Nocardioides TaxID=2615069 RepID=UPI003671F6F1